jgi:hypothetical protein
VFSSIDRTRRQRQRHRKRFRNLFETTAAVLAALDGGRRCGNDHHEGVTQPGACFSKRNFRTLGLHPGDALVVTSKELLIW